MNFSRVNLTILLLLLCAMMQAQKLDHEELPEGLTVNKDICLLDNWKGFDFTTVVGETREIGYDMSELVMKKATVRDVWRKKNLGKVSGLITTMLSANGVCLYYLEKLK